MPLLPREAKLSLDRDGVIQWKSLLGVLPVEPVGSGESVGSGQLPVDSKTITVPSAVAENVEGAYPAGLWLGDGGKGRVPLSG